MAVKQQIQDPKGSGEEEKESTDPELQDRLQLFTGNWSMEGISWEAALKAKAAEESWQAIRTAHCRTAHPSAQKSTEMSADGLG